MWKKYGLKLLVLISLTIISVTLLLYKNITQPKNLEEIKLKENLGKFYEENVGTDWKGHLNCSGEIIVEKRE